MSRRSVQVERFNEQPYAKCQQCDRLTWQANRERVRQHVNETGHTVHFVIENRTVYKPIQEPTS